jgi:hypothetical protein
MGVTSMLSAAWRRLSVYVYVVKNVGLIPTFGDLFGLGDPRIESWTERALP